MQLFLELLNLVLHFESYLLLVCDNRVIIVFCRLELILIDLNNTFKVDKQYYSCVDFKTEVSSSQGACQKGTMN